MIKKLKYFKMFTSPCLAILIAISQIIATTNNQIKVNGYTTNINKKDTKKWPRSLKIAACVLLGLVVTTGVSYGVYEIMLNHYYQKNKGILDINKEEIKNLSPLQRLKKFEELTSNFDKYKKYSGLRAIFYSIADAILFRNAKQMQNINAKRMIAFNKGICRNYATLVSYYLDELEIPNHLMVYKISSTGAHVFNIYFNVRKKRWEAFDLAFGIPCDEYVNNGRVIESSKNWDKKSQGNLMTVSYTKFMEDPINCTYDKKMCDYLNLQIQLLKFYS